MITGSALHVLLNCCHLHLSTEGIPKQECFLLGFWENSPGFHVGRHQVLFWDVYEILHDGKVRHNVFIAQFSFLQHYNSNPYNVFLHWSLY